MPRSTATTVTRLACLASLALAVGCTANTTCRSWVGNGFKVGPEYCRPAAPLEVEWIDLQSDPRLVGETVDLSHWWTALGDPTLNGLVEAAYGQNLTLREAATRIRQADAIRSIAVGALFPQVQQAVGDYQRVQASQNVAVPSPVRNFSQFDLGLQAGWELDFWGRYRRSIEVADANLDASIAGYDEVAVLLLSDVAATYVEIRTAQARLAIARSIVGLQEGSLDIAQARFDANQTNKLDVIQAQNNIDVTEAAIPLLESQLRTANNRMCVLLGMPPQDFVSQLPPAPIPAVSRLVQVGIPADLLRRRPDIRVAERQMQAQSARIGVAESDLYPRISLVGSFEWQAERIEDLFEPASVFGLISPGFSWNILNYGRLWHSVELEEERFRETVYNYQQTVLTAQQEVEDAIVGFLKAQDRADKLAQAVGQVNEAEEIALTLYKTGATDFNRVFLIQAFQFSQQDELVVSRAAAVLNLIQIYKSLGGGWEIRCRNRVSSLPPLQEDDPTRGTIGVVPPREQDPPPSADMAPPAEPVPPPTPTPSLEAPQPQPQPPEPRLERLLDDAGADQQPAAPTPLNQRLQELLDKDD